MKTIITILVTAGVSFAASYVIVSNKKASQHGQESSSQMAQWEAEKDRLEKELKTAKARAGRVEQITTTVEVPVVDKTSPRDILDRLVALKPGESGRSQTLRQIIHQLENLADLGPAALPAIREFLALNQDVEYERDRERSEESGERREGEPGRGGPGGPGGGGTEGRGGPPGGFGGFFASRMQPPSDFLYPPSLRLGLLSLLKNMGGPEAEVILGEVLATSARGIEVAFVARALEEAAPGKYRDVAISSAKDLLMNPIVVAEPSRLDRNSKGYLYGVLAMYNDTSFAGTAQALLVSADGQIDRDALGYLTGTLKEQAMPAIYQAFKDPRITNQMEKASLFTSAMNYTGISPQANQMWQEVVTGENSGMMRFMAIGSLTGGEFGPMRSQTPTDPRIIQGRLQLLQSIKPTITDERLSGMVGRVEQNLQNLLEGKPVESGRGGFGGDRGGDRGRGRP